MAELAKQFSCVRVQSMNGVNISFFQFDYDLTWMAFFMDAHDRFYCRYGGREDSSAESHLTKASLVKTMREVLSLHSAGAAQKSRFEPVLGEALTPEEIAPLNKRIMARKQGNRCIHCHDVKQGQLEVLQAQGKFQRSMIYTYPMPSALGIDIDPDDQTLVRQVKAGSPAGHAGVRAGDRLLDVEGQRLVTVADFSRVLEKTPSEASPHLNLKRAGESLTTMIALKGDWRTSPDPSWRSSTYVAGPNAGFWAVPELEKQRQALGIPADKLALHVSFLFPGHPTPSKSGIKLNDVIIEVDGDRRLRTIKQLHAQLQMHRAYGEKVPIVILRNGKEMKLTLFLQEAPSKLQ